MAKQAHRVETEYHVLDFDSKKSYKSFLNQGPKAAGVSLDYYMFEFDLEPIEVDSWQRGTRPLDFSLNLCYA